MLHSSTIFIHRTLICVLLLTRCSYFFFFFFFNDTATTEIYTLSLHDALPIFSILTSLLFGLFPALAVSRCDPAQVLTQTGNRDRKSTRLNSSHGYISYAVFCLKKKKK